MIPHKRQIVNIRRTEQDAITFPVVIGSSTTRVLRMGPAAGGTVTVNFGKGSFEICNGSKTPTVRIADYYSTFALFVLILQNGRDWNISLHRSPTFDTVRGSRAVFRSRHAPTEGLALIAPTIDWLVERLSETPVSPPQSALWRPQFQKHAHSSPPSYSRNETLQRIW